MELLFKCDKKSCKVCRSKVNDCTHTCHIEHAADIPDNIKKWIIDNFEVVDTVHEVAFQKENIIH